MLFVKWNKSEISKDYETGRCSQLYLPQKAIVSEAFKSTLFFRKILGRAEFS